MEIAGAQDRILVGPETSDDGGVYLLDGRALVATADYITPVCDDPRRFGRVAAANSLSDVYAMGGVPVLALSLACFPDRGLPDGTREGILAGAGDVLAEEGAALLGGHSTIDDDLKFGLAVIGRADPDRLLSNDRARDEEVLILTKPLGTGVLVNAFKLGKLDAEGLEPVLEQMETLNAAASRIALEHGVRAATDVTGFGLAGHALNLARGSGLRLRIRFEDLPVHDGFYEFVERGVSTGSTEANHSNVEGALEMRRDLTGPEEELLFDPQTSGGLLLSVPREEVTDLLEDLRAEGVAAAPVGETVKGAAGIEVI